MAVAGSEGLAGSLLVPAAAALLLLGVLVYLGALCAACRRKGRKKKIPPDGVKLVDKSLLRQTQLRSLSKSDTKLHELYRLRARADAQRPASLDLLCPGVPPGAADSISVLLHRELPQIPIPQPPAAAPEQTYSNLLFSPLSKPGPETVYECLPVGGEDAPAAPSSQGLGPGAADYACVQKVKKMRLTEVQDGTLVGLPAAPQVKMEEMYSTVCKATKKKKKATQVPTASPREVGAGWSPPGQEERALAGCWSPAAQGSPSEPCYESIKDRSGSAQGCGPDPDYEAVDVGWRKVLKQQKSCAPENLYESLGDMWPGECHRTSARPAANSLEVYITNL